MLISNHSLAQQEQTEMEEIAEKMKRDSDAENAMFSEIMKGLRSVRGDKLSKEDVLINELEQNIKNGRTGNALRNVDKLIELLPNESSLFRIKGNLEYTSNFYMALIDYKKFIKMDPSSEFRELIYNNIGDLSNKLFEYDTAANYFGRAIILNHSNYRYYSGRCYSYLKLKKYDSAFNDCSVAIKLEPLDLAAYVNRVDVCLSMSSTNNSLIIADINTIEALDLSKMKSRLYMIRGQTKMKLKLYPDAILDLNLALRSDKTNKDLWCLFGNCFLLTSQNTKYKPENSAMRLDSAQFYADKLWMASTNFLCGLDLQTNILIKKKDYKSAIVWANRGIIIDSNNAYLYNKRGFAYYQLRLFDEAKADNDKCILLGIKNPEYIIPTQNPAQKTIRKART